MFAEKIKVLFSKFSDAGFASSFIVGVILFALLYFFLMRFLSENGSGRFALVFVVVMILSAEVFVFCGILGAVYILIPIGFFFMVLTLHSVEYKRLMWSKRKTKLTDVKHGISGYYDEDKVEKCISEIIKALQNMSKNNIGAILILSADNIPEQIIDSGVKIDSEISTALIESVFFPKTPLHDGAMIISDTKIVASGCFLPLSQNANNIPKDLGTRHRAGIGITETVDVVAIIVSEETGIISIAKGGKIVRYADAELLRKTLNKYYWQDLESSRK